SGIARIIHESQSASVKPNKDAMLRVSSDFGPITDCRSKLRRKIQLTHGLYRVFLRFFSESHE
ncbi:MAG: hypothetical protein ABFD97_10760, partial [Syntrophobacter sp.]